MSKPTPPQVDLSNRLTQKKEVQLEYDEGLVETHHLFMKEYGWIPLEEFRKLPISTKENLLAKINRDYEERAKQIEKTRKRK